MKRQIESQGIIRLWDQNTLDIDPFSLPQHYQLSRTGVISKTLRIKDEILIGKRSTLIKSYLNNNVLSYTRINLRDYLGVAVRVSLLNRDNAMFAISVNLHHTDMRYCFPLYLAYDFDVALTRVQTWSRILKLPVLMPALDGTWREPVHELDHLKTKPAYLRNPRQYLCGRKAILPAFRDVGDKTKAQYTVKGREMIAPE